MKMRAFPLALCLRIKKPPRLNTNRDEGGISRYHSTSYQSMTDMHSYFHNGEYRPDLLSNRSARLLQDQFSNMGHCLTPADSSLKPCTTYSFPSPHLPITTIVHHIKTVCQVYSCHFLIRHLEFRLKRTFFLYDYKNHSGSFLCAHFLLNIIWSI